MILSLRLPDFEDTSGRQTVAARLFVIQLSRTVSGLPTMGSPKIGVAEGLELLVSRGRRSLVMGFSGGRSFQVSRHVYSGSLTVAAR